MDIEKELEAMWKDILGNVVISRDLNFFRIGGHSLRAIQLASRIKKRFKIKLLVREIFSASTIAQQAALIRERTMAETDLIPPVEKKPFYELSHSQKRIWITEQGQMRRGGVYNISGCFVVNTAMNLSTMIDAFEQLIRRHESLRTTFLTMAGQPYQRIQESLPFAPAIYDVRQEPDPWTEVHEKITACAEVPFNLEEGPLFRIQLYRVEDEQWVIQLVMHHIISDGWSVQVLIRDFLEYYQGFEKNSEPDFRPLAIQYKDFAAWHNQWVNGAKANAALEYWQQQLKGSQPWLNLPADRPRPERKSGEGALMSAAIPQNIIDAVLRNSNSQKAVTVLALSVAILHKYTGQTDIVIGMPFAGRFMPELEDQVGCYINMLLLRIRFAADDSFSALVAACESAMLQAMEQEALPLDLVMERIDRSGMQAGSALFNTSVSYNNFDIALKQTHGFPVEKVERILVPQTSSKFDLTFHFYDAPAGFSVGFEYNTDIFYRERIAALYKHFEALITEVAQFLEKPLSELLIWDSIELAIMNVIKTELHTDKELLLHDDFMKIARHPDMPARIATSLNQLLDIGLSAGDLYLFPNCYALAGYIRNNITIFQ